MNDDTFTKAFWNEVGKTFFKGERGTNPCFLRAQK